MEWPHGKRFAFSIIDDTDNSYVSTVEPIYEFLYGFGIRTTKTVWVYPPRDQFVGGCLLEEEYCAFVRKLEERGFEIALHNVGSGEFTREEIMEGIEQFRRIMGFYSKIHINHASNPDNIYWGCERFAPIVNFVTRILYGEKRVYYGSNPASQWFWAIYARNISNTLGITCSMVLIR